MARMKLLTGFALACLFLLPAQAATRVVVLPFEAPTDHPASNALGPGTMDALITALAHVPAFILVDRLTLDQVLKEQALSASGYVDARTAVTMGKLLGAQAMITGRVHVLGEEVRISASFIDTDTGRVRDAEQVTGNLTDLFGLQDALAHRFVDAMDVDVTPEQRRQVTQITRATASVKGYNAYQKAQGLVQLGTAKSFEDSLPWFDVAIAEDPRFALAHAGKAAVIAHLRWLHQSYYHTTSVPLEDGLTAARTALSLVPDLARGLTATALIRQVAQQPQALEAAQRATQLTPTDADAWLSLWLVSERRSDGPALARSLTLNPRHVMALIHKGDALLQEGRFGEATRTLQQALTLSPASALANYFIGLSEAMQGHSEKAVTAFQAAVQLNPAHAAAFCELGDALRSLSRYNDARDAYRQALHLRPDYHDAHEGLATLDRQDREQ